MFLELYEKIVKYNKIDDWYIWANMFKGKFSMTTFHSLDAYWPGLQVIYLTLLYNRQEGECVVKQCSAKKMFSAIF